MRRGSEAKRTRRTRALFRREIDARFWTDRAEQCPADSEKREAALRGKALAEKECQILRQRLGVT